MKNKYARIPNSELAILAQQMADTIGTSPSVYGASSGQVGALGEAVFLLESKVAEAEAARVASKAATAAQNSAREDLIAQVSVLARQMFAKTGMTPGLVTATGLVPHDEIQSPIEPDEPTYLIATPFADGQVKLEWKRNANPYGVIFVIEASIDGAPWAQVFATKRATVKIPGFTPGVKTTFRVKASNRGQFSAPSLPATIYAPEPTAEFLIRAA